MEVATVLRLLWRRRLRVALGAVVAVALAAALGRSPSPAIGVATTKVVIDTPESQLATDAPSGVESLGWRATLLGMRLATDPARQQIGRELHVPPSQIAAIDLELTAPTVPASLPTAAVQAENATSQPYVLKVHTDDVVPIISLEATAPDRTAAARLALAAVHALQAGTSPRDTADVQGLNVRQVAPVQVREQPPRHGRAKMAALAAIVFLVWCVCLALGPAIATAIRPITDPGAARS